MKALNRFFESSIDVPRIKVGKKTDNKNVGR